MIEWDMEDLIAEYPDEFFPNRGFALIGRQQTFAGVGRFDLLFEDRFKTKILMELKAVTAKYDVATQLAKYKDELQSRGEDRLLMWLVAPQIPTSVREFMDRIGIEYTEIHLGEFRRVAERNSFTIRSESSSVETIVFEERDVPARTKRLKGSAPSILKVQTGARVKSKSVFRWKAQGYDLTLGNPESLDSAEFESLVEAFETAVPSRRNASLTAELRKFAANPKYSVWPNKSNASLLRWVTTSSYKAAVPYALAIWKYLFGEPVPTWYVWSQGKGQYEFFVDQWSIWFESLN